MKTITELKDIRDQIKDFLRDIFVNEIYKCFEEGIDYEDIPQKCWNETFGSEDSFIKRRVQWYKSLEGNINDFFPIVLMPPDYANYQRPIKLIHFDRMKLIFELYLRWFYTWKDSVQWTKLYGKIQEDK